MEKTLKRSDVLTPALAARLLLARGGILDATRARRIASAAAKFGSVGRRIRSALLAHAPRLNVLVLDSLRLIAPIHATQHSPHAKKAALLQTFCNRVLAEHRVSLKSSSSKVAAAATGTPGAVLLVLSLQDRLARVHTNIPRLLSDRQCQQAIEAMRPHLLRRRYSAAVAAALERISSDLRANAWWRRLFVPLAAAWRRLDPLGWLFACAVCWAFRQFWACTRFVMVAEATRLLQENQALAWSRAEEARQRRLESSEPSAPPLVVGRGGDDDEVDEDGLVLVGGRRAGEETTDETHAAEAVEDNEDDAPVCGICLEPLSIPSPFDQPASSPSPASTPTSPSPIPPRPGRTPFPHLPWTPWAVASAMSRHRGDLSVARVAGWSLVVAGAWRWGGRKARLAACASAATFAFGAAVWHRHTILPTEFEFYRQQSSPPAAAAPAAAAAPRPQCHRLECGHSFHRQCIRRWLQRNPSCPLCRRPIDAAAAEADTDDITGTAMFRVGQRVWIRRRQRRDDDNSNNNDPRQQRRAGKIVRQWWQQQQTFSDILFDDGMVQTGVPLADILSIAATTAAAASTAARAMAAARRRRSVFRRRRQQLLTDLRRRRWRSERLMVMEQEVFDQFWEVAMDDWVVERIHLAEVGVTVTEARQAARQAARVRELQGEAKEERDGERKEDPWWEEPGQVCDSGTSRPAAATTSWLQVVTTAVVDRSNGVGDGGGGDRGGGASGSW